MNNLADLELEMLDIRPNIETVAINSVLELHHLLAQLGGIEKVVSSIKSMKPMIIMVVEQRSELQRSGFSKPVHCSFALPLEFV
ncbi:hypothetical protein LWI28_010643 [Acer negundo]|uniref:Uncharacterized protein n=1 Tax=Acer negundo TaxID=4023 RepID=A0AAD5JD30_ACENE|nr:hypothetical protein LWI28_010643 [Acer negundo]